MVNFARIVPDGMLVFFPSYTALSSCIDAWQTPGEGGRASLWEQLLSHKKAVVEPRESALFQARERPSAPSRC